MHKFLLLTISFSMYLLTGIAQTPGLKWSKYLGINHSNLYSSAFNIYDIKRTSDKGYIIAAYDSIHAFVKEKLLNKTFGDLEFVVKTDSIGNIIWIGAPDGIITSVIETVDGNYVLAGMGLSSYSYLIIKLTQSGNHLWTKTYGGSQIERAYQIKQTTDNGFIVAGYSNSSDGDVVKNHPNTEAWLLKLDANGNKQWSQTYGGSGNDTAYAVYLTPDGGYIVCGTSTSTDGDAAGSLGSSDGWVLK